MRSPRREEAAARRLFADRLRRRREAIDMTQEELAARVGRPQGVVSEWEHGHRRTNMTDVWRLAHALDCTVGHLYGPPRTPEEVEFFHQRWKQADISDGAETV